MLKKQTGLTAVDISIAIVAIMIFTSIIMSLMYNVRNENLRIKAKALATIYLTEISENIGIAKYEQVTEDNSNIIPENIPDSFITKVKVESPYSSENDDKKDIIKKVNIEIKYTINNKSYTENFERLKIKE